MTINCERLEPHETLEAALGRAVQVALVWQGQGPNNEREYTLTLNGDKDTTTVPLDVTPGGCVDGKARWRVGDVLLRAQIESLDKSTPNQIVAWFQVEAEVIS